jgi:hypothetical protein
MGGQAPRALDGRVNEVFPACVLDAPAGLADGDYRVLIIGHGPTNDGRRYYSRQVLERAVSDRVFDDSKMYWNHSDPLNDGRRGHRDVRDYCATIRPGTACVTDRGLEAVCHAHSPDLRAMLADPVARKQIGISHDSFIRYRTRQIDGREMQAVETITKCNSVDWVPAGNARGRVVESDQEDLDMDADAVRVLVREALDEALPGVVGDAVARAADERIAAAIPGFVERVREVLTAPQAEEPVAVDGIEELRTQNVALQRKVEALETAGRVAECEREVERIVEAAEGVTAAGRARVVRQFAGQVIPQADIETRVAEALDEERAYEQEILRERGVRTRVSGAGAGEGAKRARESYEESLEAFWHSQGFSAEEIQRMKEVN